MNGFVWQYSNRQVGSPFLQSTSTPETVTLTVDNIEFTVSHISNINNFFNSSLSFIAVMETNRKMITCVGGGNRNDVIVQLGNGKDHGPCTHVLNEFNLSSSLQTPLQQCLWWVWSV